jgi:hypothetical protein
MSIKYPKGEIVWVSYRNSNNKLCYIITSKILRDYYYIYELIDSEFKKLGKAKNPTELEKKFIIYEKTEG